MKPNKSPFTALLKRFALMYLFVMLSQFQFAQNWTSLGPASSIGSTDVGRVYCIRFDPSYVTNNIMYAGSASGGLWKRTGSGTWANNSGNLPVLGVSDLVIDPSSPPASRTMYIATGGCDEQDESGGYSMGVYKTTDGGNTWSPTGLSFNASQKMRIGKLIMHPTNPQILLAAVSDGVYKTTDGGTTWIKTLSALNVKDLKFNTGNPGIVYASSAYPVYDVVHGGGFFKSTNTGDSFTPVTIDAGVATINICRIAIGVTTNDANYVYLLISGFGAGDGLLGVYQSTNGGDNFTLKYKTPDNLVLYQGYMNLAIAVNPTDKNDVYVAGVTLSRSTNGGSNWTGIRCAHTDIHTVEFATGSSTNIYVGNDGGVEATTNNGTSWSDASRGLAIKQTYDLDVAATDQGLTLTGSLDNGTLLLQAGAWSTVGGCGGSGDGGTDLIDYTNADICYFSSPWGLCKYVRSTGTTTQIVGSSTPGVGDNTGNIWPLAMHPANSQTILAGAHQIYRTTDGGTSWSAALGNISIPGMISNCCSPFVTALAYAPSNPNVIYAVQQAYVSGNPETFYNLFSTNNGSDASPTWTNITAGLPALELTAIAVDPVNPLRVWVTCADYDPGNKVWFSNNGGAAGSWTNISGTLPNIPVNCITYQNNTNDGVFVGTDVGVYYRDATMTDWRPYNTGLPNVKVNRLVIQYGSRVIRAATWGRGLWESPLPPASNLYTQDVATDNGIEPDPSTQPMWQSQDIWLRQTIDASGAYAHVSENAQYPATNYVYVEVRNAGNLASSGTEQLNLYWAKAGSGLSWPVSWDGSTYFDPPANTMIMGHLIGTQTIPSIAAGGTAILQFEWTTPNPDIYTLPELIGDRNHFCLLSRITTGTAAPYGMTFPETSDLNQNVLQNNKVAWRNIGVFPIVTPPQPLPMHVIIGNMGNVPMKVKLKFEVLDDNGVTGLLNKGRLTVEAVGKMRGILKELSGKGVTKNDNGFEVFANNATVQGIALQPKEIGALNMLFTPNADTKIGKGYAVVVTQIEDVNGTERIVGGQTFVFGQVKGFGPPNSNSFWCHYMWWFISFFILLLLIIIWYAYKRAA